MGKIKYFYLEKISMGELISDANLSAFYSNRNYSAFYVSDGFIAWYHLSRVRPEQFWWFAEPGQSVQLSRFGTVMDRSHLETDLQ